MLRSTESFINNNSIDTTIGAAVASSPVWLDYTDIGSGLVLAALGIALLIRRNRIAQKEERLLDIQLEKARD